MMENLSCRPIIDKDPGIFHWTALSIHCIFFSFDGFFCFLGFCFYSLYNYTCVWDITEQWCCCCLWLFIGSFIGSLHACFYCLHLVNLIHISFLTLLILITRSDSFDVGKSKLELEITQAIRHDFMPLDRLCIMYYVIIILCISYYVHNSILIGVHFIRYSYITSRILL